MSSMPFEHVGNIVGRDVRGIEERLTATTEKADYFRQLLDVREVLMEAIALSTYIYDGNSLVNKSTSSESDPSFNLDSKAAYDTLFNLQGQIAQIVHGYRLRATNVRRRIAFFALVRRPLHAAMDAMDDVLLFCRFAAGDSGEPVTVAQMRARLNGKVSL